MKDNQTRFFWLNMSMSQIISDRWKMLYALTDLTHLRLDEATPSYLEAEDYSPDESKCEAVVSVNYVVRTHILQMNLLLL